MTVILVFRSLFEKQTYLILIEQWQCPFILRNSAQLSS